MVIKRTKRNVAKLYRQAAKMLEEHPEKWTGYSGRRVEDGQECFCAMGAVCLFGATNPLGWADPKVYPGSTAAESEVLGIQLWQLNDDLYTGTSTSAGASDFASGLVQTGKTFRGQEFKPFRARLVAKALRKIASHLDHGGKLANSVLP